MPQSLSLPMEKIAGAESWLLSKGHVEAALTREGGHLAPVKFKLGSRCVSPFSVAPWAAAGEKLDPSTPPILKILRGDFFCAPFGGNEKPHNGEQHPLHGESANAKWKLVSVEQSNRELLAEFSLNTTVRPGTIRKQIRLVGAHTCVYQRHTLTGFTGQLPLGHHATLKFPDEPMSGFLSCAPFVHGQVFPGAFENPVLGGYQSLKPGATFKILHDVPMIDGSSADLTHYPARPGFEDLVMLVTNPKQRLGWNAVTFPREGYIWFALRDTRVLRNTILWISNGGRHYAPWNGRHTHIMGIEDVTAYFHYGLAESASDNPLSMNGMPTAVDLDPSTPLEVNYIIGVAAVPAGFGRVTSIRASEDRKSVIITSDGKHEITAAVDLDWLYTDTRTK